MPPSRPEVSASLRARASGASVYVNRALCVTRMAASALLKAMLRGPYERRRRSLRQRLLRIGVRGWLWVVAAAIALLVVGFRLV